MGAGASELAQVEVSVEWARPAWRVYWQEGPTREALLTRAAALGTYRVGAPLSAEALRFIRTNSAQAIALGWLAIGVTDQAQIEAWCEDTGYPEQRFDGSTLAAADLLARLGRGDTAEMGALLEQASPPVRPPAQLDPVRELTGRVTSIRWPAREPPRTANPRGHPTHLSTLRQTPGAGAPRSPGEVLQRRLPGRCPPSGTGSDAQLCRMTNEQEGSARPPAIATR